MPQGIGARNVSARELRALRGVTIAGTDPDDLVRTGMRAVRASAASVGPAVARPAADASHGRDHSRPDATVHAAAAPAAAAPPGAPKTTRLLVVAGLAGAILIASAGMLAWWWRQRDAEPGLG